MTKKIKVHYPWSTTPPQGAFFVPSLKLKETKDAGFKAALHYGMIAKADFGTNNGKLGVWFTRVR